MGRHGHAREQHPGDAPLDVLEHRVRHPEHPHSAVPLGNLRPVVVGWNPVADGIQGAEGKPQVPGQGGALLIDDSHGRPSLPGSEQNLLYGERRGGIPQHTAGVLKYRCGASAERSEYA